MTFSWHHRNPEKKTHPFLISSSGNLSGTLGPAGYIAVVCSFWAALNFEFDLYGSSGIILHRYVETSRNGAHGMSYTRTHPDVHKNTNIVFVTMDPQLWVHFSCSWPFFLLPVCVFFKCSNCSLSVVMTMGVNLFWLIFKAFFHGSHLTTATPAYEHWYRRTVEPGSSIVSRTVVL